MSFTAIQICNLAGARLGGFGDQVAASGQISSLADTDPISEACELHYPKAVEQVLSDMAMMKAPLRCSLKSVELDDELTDDDVVISEIAVGASPYVVTITTDEAHGKTTGDTVVLKGIDGDYDIGSALNGKVKTITVTSTTTFTLNQYSAWVTGTAYVLGALVSNGSDYYRCIVAHTAGTFATDLAAGDWLETEGATHYATTGDSDWDYDEDSGTVSRAPEMGPWAYAFDKPSDCLTPYRVTDESYGTDETTRHEYRYDLIRNKDNDGDLILTNELTNADADGIYFEFVFNPTTYLDESDATPFNVVVVDAIATILASYLAPTCGRNTDVALAMLTMYKNQALPDAIAFNQSQINKTAVAPSNFRGGRVETLPTGFGT